MPIGRYGTAKDEEGRTAIIPFWKLTPKERLKAKDNAPTVDVSNVVPPEKVKEVEARKPQQVFNEVPDILKNLPFIGEAFEDVEKFIQLLLLGAIILVVLVVIK